MSADSADELEDLRGVMDKASELLSSWAVPLYEDEGKRPSQIGTGFFVATPSAVFLASAAHVLRRGKKRGLYYFVEPRITRPLSGELHVSKHSQIDIGALRLRPEALPPYPAVGKVAMRPSTLRSEALPRTGKHYMVIGFPRSKNRSNPSNNTVAARLCAYRSASISAERYTECNIDPATHLALPFNPKEGVDSRNERTVFPDPHGMSGAPVWLIHDEATDDAAFHVVGIAIEYRKPEHLLVATDAGFLLEMLV